jgi:hypothetical protein
MRVTRTWGAAFVAALAYTYSTVRLVHHEHFQLVVGGALVPATLLAALRCLEAPSAKRGLVLGLAFTALALTATYDAALMAVMLAIVAGGWTEQRAIGARRRPRRRHAHGGCVRRADRWPHAPAAPNRIPPRF